MMSKSGRLSRLFPRLFRGEAKDKVENSTNKVKGPFCLIVFLDDAEKNIAFKGNWKGQTIFDNVCTMINLLEKDYFGLRLIDYSGQTHWLNLSKGLSSQLKVCSEPHKLYFCVKFYAADPCKLRDEITRYLFFLQIKRDILQGRLPVAYDEVAELCGYALQSELGDYDPRLHTTGYVSEFCFIPNQTEELEAKIAGIHRRCVGATPLMAEQKYLEKVKWLELYGVDLHPVQGESNVEYFLGLTPTGVVVYKHKTKVASYFWPRVTKASHKGKMFTIRVKDKNNDENVYGFELSTKSACKHLWKCCIEHHAFFSGRSSRLAATETRSRQQPTVQRTQSRRQARRSNSDSRLVAEQWHNDQHVHKNRTVLTVLGQAEPVRAPRHRSLPELQGRQSPRSIKSAPWESKLDYGLYTSGHDSPSVYSDSKYPGSDSQSGISQRKRYFPNTKASDNESDASASRRRRRELDSDSGSEISFPHSGHNRKIRHTMSDKDMKLRSNGNLFYPYHDKENLSQGSIPSLHSAPAGEAKQRRRRRRSKSPGNTKRPPEELKQHIEFDLVDTEGMTEDQLRDIPYTKVETKSNLFRVKYSPKIRHKIWASRRKSFGDVDRNSPSKSGSNSTVSRQDSYYTDPSGKYIYGSRVSGSLSQGNLPRFQNPESHQSNSFDQSLATNLLSELNSSHPKNSLYNENKRYNEKQHNSSQSQTNWNEVSNVSESDGYRNYSLNTNPKYSHSKHYSTHQQLRETPKVNTSDSNRLSYREELSYTAHNMQNSKSNTGSDFSNKNSYVGSNYKHSTSTEFHHQSIQSHSKKDLIGSIRDSRNHSPYYRETLPDDASTLTKGSSRPNNNQRHSSAYHQFTEERNSKDSLQLKYNSPSSQRMQNTYNNFYNVQSQGHSYHHSPRSGSSVSPRGTQSTSNYRQHTSNLVTQL
ncbi:band 4.1-like protein 4 isoform X1 [Biomphalaria pfeifferi]|uniref:Band 4.1-like protein 4 isoform X1 n=1 Tax=Biomphalaria pfeifferi TaxID=112525 RepID=A0AAD8FPI0_BIOPF|nr:band 4.1-like protein 4 isoform X1 [Biomphalaria pfeifferi]